MRKPGYSAAAPDGMPALGQTWVQALASARCGDDPTVGKAKIVPDAKSGYSAAAPDRMPALGRTWVQAPDGVCAVRGQADVRQGKDGHLYETAENLRTPKERLK